MAIHKQFYIKAAILCISLIILFPELYAQADSVPANDKTRVKTGWSFGAVPAIAFDTDIGFKYGGVVNLYNYGDGSAYPKYCHSLYFEWSRTTKGSGINQFTYDSEYLIPKIRINAEASLLTEKALDFYGFNGYKSYYNAAFEDDTKEDEYISRMYYRLDRELTRLKIELQGKIKDNKIRWLTGISHFNNKIGTVDIDALNKGKDPVDTLPHTDLLYDKYIEWGIIPDDQKKGGVTNFFKIGIIYDTRDNEPNPMRGIWTTLQFIMAPKCMGNGDYSFTKMALTHRHYFTLIPVKMNLALRTSYQAEISGEMPFYMLPFIYNSAPTITRDGLGGARTLRGILRNRVVGDDYLYGNIELRYKIIRTVVFKQNLYIALNGFTDYGMVTKEYKLPEITNTEALEYLNSGSREKLHISCGGGIHIALNENFVIAIDYGLAKNKQDGVDGFYMNLNWLY